MRSHDKPSITSRASVRLLIAACLPASAVALAADLPALHTAFDEAANRSLAVDDNVTSRNNLITNSPATSHADPNAPRCFHGIRG